MLILDTDLLRNFFRLFVNKHAYAWNTISSLPFRKEHVCSYLRKLTSADLSAVLMYLIMYSY